MEHNQLTGANTRCTEQVRRLLESQLCGCSCERAASGCGSVLALGDLLMKQNLRLITCFAVALLFVGCASWTIQDSAARYANRDAKASGSPYRYRVRHTPQGVVLEKYRATPPSVVAVPANLQQTAGDAKLTQDILADIARLQSGWGDTTVTHLLDVQALGSTKDGVKESWFIKHGDGAVRYDVSLTQRSTGVAFTINVP